MGRGELLGDAQDAVEPLGKLRLETDARRGERRIGRCGAILEQTPEDGVPGRPLASGTGWRSVVVLCRSL
jgi:hypothetical protein